MNEVTCLELDPLAEKYQIECRSISNFIVGIWDANNGQELQTLKRHTDEVRGVAFSPDGQRIVSGSRDKTMKTWDAIE